MLAAADALLTAIHVGIILAFLLLWIPKSTARLHGFLVLLTAASWFGLGLFRGFGYCFVTDLQWRVKHARGIARLPHSFIKYAADAVTGRDIPAQWVDSVAAAVFVLGSCAALWRCLERKRGSARSRKGVVHGSDETQRSAGPIMGKVTLGDHTSGFRRVSRPARPFGRAKHGVDTGDL